MENKNQLSDFLGETIKSVPHENLHFCSNDGIKSVYKIPSATGAMTCYDIFSGVQICFNDLQTTQSLPSQDSKSNIMEINYCIRGRHECEFSDGTCSFIGEGDLCVNMFHHTPKNARFPLGYYEGIGLFLDMERAPYALAHAMNGVEIDLKALCQKLHLGTDCFFLPSNPSISHIFSDLYDVDPQIKISYFKIKTLELLLFLGSDRVLESKRAQRYYPRFTVDAVKAIKEKMTQEYQTHFTLEELAAEHAISLSSLKNCFRDIYGQTPYAYLKQYRIQRAAKLLCEGGHSIGWIANHVGYGATGKFAAAFKSIMGCPPSEYRKTHSPVGM